MGDWHCANPSCKNHTDNLVFGSKPSCPICGMEKPAPPPGGHGPPQQQHHQGYQYGAQQAPLAFHAAAPQGGAPGVSRGRPGDWHCANSECKNHRDNFVFSSKPNCPICGTPKPEDGSGAIDPSEHGAPQQQHHQGYQYGAQQVPPLAFHAAAPQGGAPGVSRARPGDWHCANSSCKNHRDNVVFSSKSNCPICGTPKSDDAQWSGAIDPSSYGQPPPPPGQPSAPAYAQYQQMGGQGKGGPGGRGQPGDWHCSNSECKNHRDNVVFASKTSCPVCYAPKPGNAAVTFSQTSRPGDWQCPNQSCKNHINGVYGSKPMCNFCGEANPNMTPGGIPRTRSRSPRQA